MPSRQVAIASSVGLHARPASLFVEKAKSLGVPVTIEKEGKKPASATSLLGVMALGARHGEVVTLTSDDEAALDELVAFLEIDHEQA